MTGAEIAAVAVPAAISVAGSLLNADQQGKNWQMPPSQGGLSGTRGGSQNQQTPGLDPLSFQMAQNGYDPRGFQLQPPNIPGVPQYQNALDQFYRQYGN